MLALATIALTLTASPPSQDKATDAAAGWSVQPKPGVRVEYMLTTERVSELLGNDRFVTTTKSEQALGIELVAANEDGTFTLACRFGPAKGTVKFDRWTEAFDSAKGIDETKEHHGAESGRSMRRVGKTARVVIDAHGAVQKVEGLAALYKGSPVENDFSALEDAAFVDEAQSWIAVLPDVVPTRGAHWTDSFPARTFGSLEIEFRPQGILKSISDAEIAWTFKTAAMGGPASKSKALPRETKNGVTTITLEARSGREWISKSPFVQAAAIEGSTTVSLQDGLAVRRVVEWEAELDLSDLAVPGRTSKVRERMRTELVRR